MKKLFLTFCCASYLLQANKNDKEIHNKSNLTNLVSVGAATFLPGFVGVVAGQAEQGGVPCEGQGGERGQGREELHQDGQGWRRFCLEGRVR